jgi:hypothetical protein
MKEPLTKTTEQEQAGLVADKLRLDFLEQNQASVVTNIAGLASGYRVLSQGKRLIAEAWGVRSAIDAAIKTMLAKE